MTGYPPFDHTDDDPAIPTLTVQTEDAGWGRSVAPVRPHLTPLPLDVTTRQQGEAVGIADLDAASVPHAEPVLRAALQAAVEDALDEALDEAVAHLRARLQTRLPEIVAQVLRQTRSG